MVVIMRVISYQWYQRLILELWDVGEVSFFLNLWSKLAQSWRKICSKLAQKWPSFPNFFVKITIFAASRPSSIIGPPLSRLHNILTPSTSGVQLVCNSCQKPSYFCDENSIVNAPTNLAMQNVITRYLAAHPSLKPTSSGAQSPQSPETPSGPQCQLCEGSENRAADVFCEQCDVYYCTPCQTALHPTRGPLAKHPLIPANGVKWVF